MKTALYLQQEFIELGLQEVNVGLRRRTGLFNSPNHPTSIQP